MDSVKPSSMTPKRNKLLRTMAKFLHLRAPATCGIAPAKAHEKFKDGKNSSGNSFDIHKDDDEFQKGLVLESLLAKLFANISSIKAAYAQLQHAQSPYDADGIQAADRLVLSHLKNLSELKQCYLSKQQFDSSPPESRILSAEVQELKSLSKTYEVVGKRAESQFRLKDSEIMYLKEKLQESHRHNRLLEKRFNLYHQSESSYSHFNTVLRHAVKSIRGFVKLMIDRMKSADWDLAAAAASIELDVDYWRTTDDDDKGFAFESFVCSVMFDGFHLPNFSLADEPLPKRSNHRKQMRSNSIGPALFKTENLEFESQSNNGKNSKQEVFFFKRFNSVKAREYLSQKPNSAFAKFCRVRYLKLVHPKMESSLFGNLSQRRLLVDSGDFPETSFFDSFAEMAKQIWLLHCLAISFEPEASIFQVNKGRRFSEVYMECVAPHAREADTSVAFTVVPGFRIGKTVIQCQVYLLSQFQRESSR